jgi:hypothetical protein
MQNNIQIPQHYANIDWFNNDNSLTPQERERFEALKNGIPNDTLETFISSISKPTFKALCLTNNDINIQQISSHLKCDGSVKVIKRLIPCSKISEIVDLLKKTTPQELNDAIARNATITTRSEIIISGNQQNIPAHQGNVSNNQGNVPGREKTIQIRQKTCYYLMFGALALTAFLFRLVHELDKCRGEKGSGVGGDL